MKSDRVDANGARAMDLGLTHEKSTVMGMVEIGAWSHMAMRWECPKGFGTVFG